MPRGQRYGRFRGDDVEALKPREASRGVVHWVVCIANHIEVVPAITPLSTGIVRQVFQLPPGERGHIPGRDSFHGGRSRSEVRMSPP